MALLNENETTAVANIVANSRTGSSVSFLPSPIEGVTGAELRLFASALQKILGPLAGLNGSDGGHAEAVLQEEVIQLATDGEVTLSSGSVTFGSLIIGFSYYIEEEISGVTNVWGNPYSGDLIISFGVGDDATFFGQAAEPLPAGITAGNALFGAWSTEDSRYGFIKHNDLIKLTLTDSNGNPITGLTSGAIKIQLITLGYNRMTNPDYVELGE